MKSNTRFKNNTRGQECLNCGQPLRSTDNFCSDCGQVNDLKPLSVKEFLKDLLAGFFAFDTRALNTVSTLLFKPGKVTLDYIKGKRMKYVNPFQLYLHTTIVFFLITSIFSNLDKYDAIIRDTATPYSQAQDSTKTNMKIGIVDIDFSEREVDSASTTKKDSLFDGKTHFSRFIHNSFAAKFDKFSAVKSSNTAFAIDSLGYEVNRWNVFWFIKAQKISKLKKVQGTKEFNIFANEFANKFESKISVIIFVMLPIFTLLFKLLYFRKKMNYTEHLIFVFHVQTVTFILLLITLIIDGITKSNIGTAIFILVMSVYFYKAMRVFYNESRFKTIYKYILANIFYLFLGLIGLSITASLALLF